MGCPSADAKQNACVHISSERAGFSVGQSEKFIASRSESIPASIEHDRPVGYSMRSLYSFSYTLKLFTAKTGTDDSTTMMYTRSRCPVEAYFGPVVP